MGQILRRMAPKSPQSSPEGGFLGPKFGHDRPNWLQTGTKFKSTVKSYHNSAPRSRSLSFSSLMSSHVIFCLLVIDFIICFSLLLASLHYASLFIFCLFFPCPLVVACLLLSHIPFCYHHFSTILLSSILCCYLLFSYIILFYLLSPLSSYPLFS